MEVQYTRSNAFWQFAAAVAVTNTWWTGRGTVLRRGHGCQRRTLLTLPSFRNLTAVILTSLGRPVPSLERGVLLRPVQFIELSLLI